MLHNLPFLNAFYSGDVDSYIAAALIIFMSVIGFMIAIAIFFIVCTWKIFTKAGKPGWAALIPIYNTWVMAEIGGLEGWWALLTLIPYVGFVAAIYITYKLVVSFGKDIGFFFGCLFLMPVFWPIMAFSKNIVYQGAAGNTPPVPGGTPPVPGGTPPVPGGTPPTPSNTPPAPTVSDPWVDGTE